MGLRDHYNKLRQVSAQSIEAGLLTLLKEEEGIATELVTGQLFEGKDSLGGELPEYSPVSVNVFGKRPGPWQLLDTGDFYRSIFLDASRFPVVFESTDPKRNEIFSHLEAKGGNADQVLGLDKGNLTELARSYLLSKTGAYFRRLL